MSNPCATRPSWTAWLLRVVDPVFSALAENRLIATMPVETSPGLETARSQTTHLEALGRSLAGVAPWLEVDGLAGEEATRRDELRAKVLLAIEHATDPSAPDHLAFDQNQQAIVDAAFLAHGLHRCFHSVWEPLDAGVKQRVVECLQRTRGLKCPFNNWLLFAAMIESFLCRVGAGWDRMRVDFAVRQFEQWYKGDGIYGDGYHHCCDYYNSFVIQPMLLDIVESLEEWAPYREAVAIRAVRYARYLERLIAPDGTFPVTGRSIAYRCGAFQHLAQMALRQQLPESLSPAQVRCALSAVIERTLGASGTFDEKGWLRVGLAGHQPSLGEYYISTGSLYLCSTAFLPLGLPPAAPFWSDPDAEWTSRIVWSGQDHPAEHSLKHEKKEMNLQCFHWC